MNTLFLVQFACCIIVSMLGLILNYPGFRYVGTIVVMRFLAGFLLLLCLYL